MIYQDTTGHIVPNRNVPTENMNGIYLISNPNHAAGKKFSTLYSSRPNVEYFDVYSPPISTRYIIKELTFYKILHIKVHFL